MSTFLDISYLALICLVVLEALVLHAVLREAIRLRGFESKQADRPAVPVFTRQLLDLPDVLSDRDLRGRTTGILFITATIGETLATHVLTSIIHALWHKFEGALYFVCAGSKERCRQLRDEQLLQRAYGGEVRVVLDSDGNLAEAFGVSAAIPSAVIVDAEGRIQRTGSLFEEQAST